MKLRFSSFDIVCGVAELQSLVGLRVNQIYDIDNKTYLIRLQGGEEAKKMLLIESGIRFHTTVFEWPKNIAPSGFSMKLRKHLKNKRLEKLQQMGVDRIVDFQFGVGEAAYHVILELYDRGNIMFTDHEMTILYILRPHREDFRFAVHKKYPCEHAIKSLPSPSRSEIVNAITNACSGDSLRRILMPLLACGPSVIDHVLTKHKLDKCIISKEEVSQKITQSTNGETCGNKKPRKSKNKLDTHQLNSREFHITNDINSLMLAIQDISEIMDEAKRKVTKGFIIQKKEDRVSSKEGKTIQHFYQNIEYHPYNFCQYECHPFAEYETFMMAVDEFYSTLEGQKIDMKSLQQERAALGKLSNVKKDHAKRIKDLNEIQEGDRLKAELITMNQALVDNAILAIQSAIANQMSWPDIQELVKAAQANRDPVAEAIKLLKLEVNQISLELSDPYHDADKGKNETLCKSIIDVDLALSAWANARKYYWKKKNAAEKEQKTFDASQKALKSAERKTQQALKDVQTISVISKARKVYWFEKFYWFISSENYLVIGGRDAQQNELIVKRYMRPNDIYVHADIHGAASVVIRNPIGASVPPKTLLEAGTMAISYSVAWNAKVVTNAYWVRSNQVSKTAPSGEYLGTGSFMIRGKKNFLPFCHLIMGLSIFFKLEDSFIEKHREDRKVRSFEEEQECQELKTSFLGSEYNSDILEVEEQNYENKGEVKKLYETNNELFSEFPDTQVKVEHDTRLISAKTNLLSPSSDLMQLEYIKINDKTSATESNEESTIISAVKPRKKQQQNAKKRNTQNQLLQKQLPVYDNQNNNLQAIKRGQKGKLKKIKAKYQDQDDEERQLRMQILKSAGKSEILPFSKEGDECSIIKNLERNVSHENKKIFHTDLEEADDICTGADVEMLDSLTGQPFDEDELLFVIPVVAPYQALQNYKYKVKLTPGTGKRGRAAKTALAMFSIDKTSTQRQKDLLKSIREETFARNIPGKVKLSAPQLQKLKK